MGQPYWIIGCLLKSTSLGLQYFLTHHNCCLMLPYLIATPDFCWLPAHFRWLNAGIVCRSYSQIRCLSLPSEIIIPQNSLHPKNRTAYGLLLEGGITLLPSPSPIFLEVPFFVGTITSSDGSNSLSYIYPILTLSSKFLMPHFKYISNLHSFLMPKNPPSDPFGPADPPWSAAKRGLRKAREFMLDAGASSAVQARSVWCFDDWLILSHENIGISPWKHEELMDVN